MEDVLTGLDEEHFVELLLKQLKRMIDVEEDANRTVLVSRFLPSLPPKPKISEGSRRVENVIDDGIFGGVRSESGGCGRYRGEGSASSPCWDEV
jgi:hypothetical protein